MNGDRVCVIHQLTRNRRRNLRLRDCPDKEIRTAIVIDEIPQAKRVHVRYAKGRTHFAESWQVLRTVDQMCEMALAMRLEIPYGAREHLRGEVS